MIFTFPFPRITFFAGYFYAIARDFSMDIRGWMDVWMDVRVGRWMGPLCWMTILRG